MPRFFIDKRENPDAIRQSGIFITGGDAVHISKVLRMKPGEELTVCDCEGTDYLCGIVEVSPDGVLLRIKSAQPTHTEPSVRVTLYQGLPKSDKMEWIVQKSVELGVHRIVPIITARCVSRPDKKSLAAKTWRWNKIASEAAKQCGRGILPTVTDAVEFKDAVVTGSAHRLPILFYEKKNGSLRETLQPGIDDIGIFIGPEGGYEETEVSLAETHGIKAAGLGPRILRTETAPLCALSAIMYETGNI